MPHVFIVDEEKWKEAQKKAEEWWASEEGQKRRQEIHDNAASFEELMKTGQTRVRVITREDAKNTRKIHLVLSLDESGRDPDDIEAIERDLQCEISCCSHSFEILECFEEKEND